MEKDALLQDDKVHKTRERIEKLEKSPSNGEDFELVKEAVIRGVEDYGEVLKKLAKND